jgi:hypothetical protein
MATDSGGRVALATALGGVVELGERARLSEVSVPGTTGARVALETF